jgi:hypothetical protein
VCPGPAPHLQLNKPKGSSGLLESVFGLSGGKPAQPLGNIMGQTTERALSSRRSGENVILRHAQTGELRRELRREGWRVTSHLASPETGYERNSLIVDLARQGGLSRISLKHNLHTFLRPAGHVICGTRTCSRGCAWACQPTTWSSSGLTLRHGLSLRACV